MRLVILTTETPHHTAFLRALAERFPVHRVLIETNFAQAPYATHHAFENARNMYEWTHWFEGEQKKLADFADTETYASLNEAVAINSLTALHADLVVVFGTGRLRRDVIAACPEGIVNLHGGDPQRYRGLDSHLWAIWHRDFAGLVTTLHRLNNELDDGEIIATDSITLKKGMKLHQLRTANTQTCIALAQQAAEHFMVHGRVDAHPQRGKGRYYSFMPVDLKAQCVRRFEAYSAALP